MKQVEVNKPKGAMSGSKSEVMGHASPVYSVNTESEKSDMGRMKYKSQDSRGYPSQAWEYKY